MKIKKIKVQNFRLLKDFELDLEKELSLVIGKNNCGKTSLLAILEKFMTDKANFQFACDDFNIDFQKTLKAKIESDAINDKEFLGISLKVFIEYNETDNLANISKVMMDLDPENKIIVLAFEYSLSEDHLLKFKHAYGDFRIEETEKINRRYETTTVLTKEERQAREGLKEQKKKYIFYDFFKKHQKDFFKPFKKSVLYNTSEAKEDDTNFTDLSTENILIDKIINLKIITARRDVSNKENDKTLSFLSSKYYEKKESTETDSVAIKQFKETLSETDNHLDTVYQGLFKNVIEKVGQFGGVRKGDSIIKIISTLQHRELLKGNTTVMYDHNAEHSLPENYNGLGYMNLIGMIFEIEVLLSDFRKENKENEEPADINLLFIEEPEAHTHPQMQYVFIKNIKKMLISASKGEDGSGKAFNLQTIITTHSSHITAESQFNDIKYFSKKDKNEIIAKNLRDLEMEYDKDGQSENFKFLKQYLTLIRAELFFADKAIFIEGDTERILLPAMMKKIDQAHSENPLLSQNISIVEVGAYSHIFEKFINFVGIKSIVITDIDGAKVIEVEKNGKTEKTVEACEMKDATLTTNASLKFFHGSADLIYYKNLSLDYKILRRKKQTRKWNSNKKGKFLIVYQKEEKNVSEESYFARSFEDSFFHLNKSILQNPKIPFTSLTQKHLNRFLNNEINVYSFVDTAIGSKPTLAMEILLNSKTDEIGIEFSNWTIPEYIKEGLLWLKKD